MIQSAPRLGSGAVAPACARTSAMSCCRPAGPVNSGLYMESSYTEAWNTLELLLIQGCMRMGTMILFWLSK